MLQRALVASTILAALGLAYPAAAATIVLSNTSAPGDAFSNPGPSNQGQAVGASG